MTVDVQALYDECGRRRSSSWMAQAVLEEGGVPIPASTPEAAPDASSSEAWWHAQGRAEAFSEVMTLLVRAGARVTLVQLLPPSEATS